MNLHGLIKLVPGLAGAAENEIAKIESHLSDESHNSGCHIDIRVSFEPDPKDQNSFRTVGTVLAKFPKLTRQGTVVLRGGELEVKRDDNGQEELPLDDAGTGEGDDE